MPATGASNRCPVCRAALWVPDHPPLGYKECPRCRGEFWVLPFSQGPAFFPRRPGESVYDLLADLAGKQLGLSPADMEAGLKSADSLDIVEMLLEVEDAIRSDAA